MLLIINIFILLACSQSPKETGESSSNIPEVSIPPSIVIIGGGASGLATAIRLVELGLSPIILERESILGGAGIHAGRFFGVETKQQTEHGTLDSVEMVLEEWSTITGSEPNQQIQHFVENSAQTLEWLETYNVVFESPVLDIGSGTKPRIHPLSPHTKHPLTTWSELLTPYAYLNTSVLSISKNSDETFDVVTNQETLVATHIVIASGGFARNTDLVPNFIPAIINFDWHMEAWPGMTGEAYEWFESNNIQTQNLEHIGLYAHSVTDPLLEYPETMIVPALERSLIVSQEGKRIFNETETQSLSSGISMLNHGPLFAIFDSDSWPGTYFQGMGYNYDPPQILSSSTFEEIGELYIGSDVQDLSQTLSISAHQLSETIETYNHGFLNNTDMYGKDLSNITPIQRPPLFAVPLVLSTGKSFGGAALSETGETNIKNIYAVGEAAGFLGTPSVGWGFSGSITACYYQGRKTAEHIYTTVSE